MQIEININRLLVFISILLDLDNVKVIHKTLIT